MRRDNKADKDHRFKSHCHPFMKNNVRVLGLEEKGKTNNKKADLLMKKRGGGGEGVFKKIKINKFVHFLTA